MKTENMAEMLFVPPDSNREVGCGFCFRNCCGYLKRQDETGGKEAVFSTLGFPPMLSSWT